MNLLQRLLFVLIILFAFNPMAFAQDKNPYQTKWDQVDSLLNLGIPKSASKIVKDILHQADLKHDQANALRARLFLLNEADPEQESSDVSAITKAEQYINNSTGVDKAIWQSVTADLYWTYFQQNRWKIYDRTTLASTTSADMATWDAPAFFDKIAALYQASLSDEGTLLQTPVNKYLPIIREGQHTRTLRPSMYDLLAFKAISFFENDEKDITKAAYKFEIESPIWFDDADRFSSVRVKIKDGNSLHFKALQCYQRIIAAHLHDAQPDALIDADLNRLNFMHNNSVSPDKDSLYVAALQRLESKYASNSQVAQVSYLIAAQKAGDWSNNTSRRSGKTKKVSGNKNLPEIVAKLKEIIAKFPGTEGAANAYNFLQSLTAQNINAQIETVNIPNEAIKALISYRNVSHVEFKLYRIAGNKFFNDKNSDSVLKDIKALSAIRTWSQDLPASEDLQSHSAEIKIDALPHGYYYLVAMANGENPDKAQLVSLSSFQVSALSLIQENGSNAAYIVDRKSGYPLKGIKATFYATPYNAKTRSYELKRKGDALSNENGLIKIPVSDNSNYDDRVNSFVLTGNDDSVSIGNYYNYIYGNNERTTEVTPHTFFFTDRAIYRPGQTIYFKGIMVQGSGNGMDNKVMPNETSVVNFNDANGQKISSLTLTSNEFGSFTGTFIAPQTGLTGGMNIENNYGNVSFSVEEYKRPKFYVDYDTLKGNDALNSEVQITGIAKAYAGSNIDGAQVKYRVVRRARFPYYWCYYYWGAPSSPEMEISNGEATTDADGKFKIGFTTIPDKAVDPKTLPVFTYTVYADVTDINGETRSGEKTIQCGYTSLQISTDVQEDSKPADLSTIAIHTQNNNGVFTAANIHVSISRLQFPGFLRKRLWEVPDQFVMSEADFHKAFPGDEYKEESNYLNWEKGKVLFEQNLTTTADTKLNIPAPTWYQNGWYVIEISGKDAQGHDVLEKKYTHVWAPGKKEATQKDLIAYTDKDSYEPGENVDLWLGSGYDQPYLFIQARRGGKAFDLSNTKNPQKLTITETDRGGINVSWLYVRNNRVYQESKSISIPWNNKDLQMDWATHRDKLQPGAAEEWTLTIKGNKKDKVAAELLAGMYDASLDAFQEQEWSWDKLLPYTAGNFGWADRYGFGVSIGRLLKEVDPVYRSYGKIYDELLFDSQRVLASKKRIVMYADGMIVNGRLNDAIDEVSDSLTAPRRQDKSKAAWEEPTAAPAPRNMALPETIIPGKDSAAPNNAAIRKNLQETAFFFPQMATDENGNVTFKFTMPEALTEWKFMGFAHTKDWRTAYLTGEVKTQKDLMVTPNLPRFFRQKDDIVISTKITNLSDKALNGNAVLELIDATTMQPITWSAFQQVSNSEASTPSQVFTVAQGQSTTATWKIHIPESRYTPVVVRISAKAGNFSDGEENTLPVITNRTLVTETMPMPVRGNEEQYFTLDKLLNSAGNKAGNTMVNHSLTVEFTGNPAWYAVQALPYLMEYPYECAEQNFNRFFANALAGHIVAQSPKIAQIFDQWKGKDSTALLSNLEKNEELKSALLEETPWVMDAKDEQEQKRRIASLFETHKLAKDLDKNISKLAQMQSADGSFPWFQGMPGSRYITQYIATGIARLQHLNVTTANNKEVKSMMEKVLPYLDEQLKDDYNNLVKSKANLSAQNISYEQIQYLYMRSFYASKSVNAATQKAFEYYKTQASTYWNHFSPYMKGQIALALNRFKVKIAPQQILASLKETATHNKEMGMYWKDMPQGYWWYEAPIEGQSLLIETFSELASDKKEVEEMKVWLLKQKQTQNWKTTKATADACYALLLQGNDWLLNQPEVTIHLGDQTIQSSKIKTEAGTGYFKQVYKGNDVKPAMGKVSVQVQSTGASDAVSWGAVYWQYFEDLDKITSAATPLSLHKQLFIERNSDNGPVLTEIKEGNELHVGDKVKVRIELRVDRDMEYVQLKDMRAACFEPVNVLSGYKYQGGLGYYESTKDIATNFFFDYLRKGTYVFEYPVFVSSKGNFSNGISTIQSMYAPEFSSHSDGIRVEVK